MPGEPEQVAQRRLARWRGDSAAARPGGSAAAHDLDPSGWTAPRTFQLMINPVLSNAPWVVGIIALMSSDLDPTGSATRSEQARVLGVAALYTLAYFALLALLQLLLGGRLTIDPAQRTLTVRRYHPWLAPRTWGFDDLDRIAPRTSGTRAGQLRLRIGWRRFRIRVAPAGVSILARALAAPEPGNVNDTPAAPAGAQAT